MDILGLIKKAISEYLENESLCNTFYATYTGGGLKIDNKPILIPSDMVNVPLHIKEGQNPLKNGDRVIAIQSQGAQSYTVIGRL